MILAFALLLIVAVTAGWLRVRTYRQWFRLPARRADRLECQGNHRVVALCVHPTGFDLPPEVELGGRTVFVCMTVGASVLGHLLDPFIEMQRGETTQRQYFERGCGGARYLNLTHLLGIAGEESPRRVRLRGRLLRWHSAASLLIFESPDVDTSSILVLAPHPDDAEAAAFGMYSDNNSCVVTVTAGERATGTMPGWVAAQSRSHWTAMLRVADSLRATASVHDSAIHRISLVFPDATLESMYREPARAWRLRCEETLPRAKLRSTNATGQFRTSAPDCRWSDLIADLRLLLKMKRPRTIICPHPLLDGHSDHAFTAVALEEALRGFPGDPPLLLLYVVHNYKAPLHPLGPMSSVASLPPGSTAQWIAASIYSHQLEPQTRQAKYFALEDMHAARWHPDVEPHSTLTFLASIKQEFSAYLAGLARQPASLLRRACRPNEIYYVVATTEFRALVERFHAGALPGKTA